MLVEEGTISIQSTKQKFSLWHEINNSNDKNIHAVYGNPEN